MRNGQDKGETSILSSAKLVLSETKGEVERVSKGAGWRESARSPHPSIRPSLRYGLLRLRPELVEGMLSPELHIIGSLISNYQSLFSKECSRTCDTPPAMKTLTPSLARLPSPNLGEGLGVRVICVGAIK